MAREISEEKRKSMPAEDFAGKNRSFPIEVPEDVHDAADSIGRAGADNYSTDELKANITRIAKRKGAAFVAELPEAWKDGGKKMAASDLSTRMTDKGPRYTVRLDELGDGSVRIPVAVLGKFVKGKQRFAITKATMSDLVKNFRKRGVDTVIDYEHASETPEVAGGGAVPASGWLKAMDDAPDADGILWGMADFTPRARDMVKAGEYRYLSPVINWGARDKNSGEAQGATLTSLALTNRPFLEQLPAIAMSDGWDVDRGDAAIVGKETKVVKIVLTDRVAGTARVMADDGTESTLTVEGMPKVLRLSDVKRDREGRLDFQSLEAGEGVVVASEVFHAMQVQGELDDAVQKTLITPAQRPFYEKMALSDIGGFRELVKTMAPKVDLTERGTGGAGMGGDLEQVQQQLFAKVDEKLKANSEMQYGQALKLVASEHPELNRRYTELSRKRMGGDKD